MLRNQQNQIVSLSPMFVFGVDYNHKENEVVGKKQNLKEYDAARVDLREQKQPRTFPKRHDGKPGMFSIGERARIKM